MGQSPPGSRSVKRLAVIAPDGTSLLRQRADLLNAVIGRRHAVLVLLPEQAADAIPQLNERGYAAATFPMRSANPHLLGDGKTIASLAATLADWRAHVVLGYGLKSMLLGAAAAKKAGVGRRVGLVTSLPDAIVGDSGAVPSWSWRRLLRSGFRALDAVVCHNDGQKARLVAGRLLPEGVAPLVVSGAGVDLERHAMQPLPAIVANGIPAMNFLVIARKDADKGGDRYCAAARLVRAKSPDTRFVLAGPDGDIDAADLEQYRDCVQIIGDQADVRPLIGAAHVVVAPSLVEGMPRVLLEALAAGRPLIASDIAGCRETIDERVNGVLVPPGDVNRLANAMTSYLKRPDLIPAMARASRAKAERRFDVRTVNAALLDVLGL